MSLLQEGIGLEEIKNIFNSSTLWLTNLFIYDIIKIIRND